MALRLTYNEVWETAPTTGGGHTMGLGLPLLVEESLLQPLLRLELLFHKLVHLVWPIDHTLSED